MKKREKAKKLIKKQMDMNTILLNNLEEMSHEISKKKYLREKQAIEEELEILNYIFIKI